MRISGRYKYDHNKLILTGMNTVTDTHFIVDIKTTDNMMLEGLVGYGEDEVRHVSVLRDDLQPRDSILISHNVRNLVGAVLLYPRKIVVPGGRGRGGGAGAGGGGHTNSINFIAEGGRLDYANTGYVRLYDLI